MVHEFFSQQRMEGEFFSVPESEVIDFFKTIQEKYDVESSLPRVEDPEAEAKTKARDNLVKFLLFSKPAKQELERERKMAHIEKGEEEADQINLKRKHEQLDLLLKQEQERERA